MTILVVQGAKIEVPEKCECGSVPSIVDIAAFVSERNSKGNNLGGQPCSFCGGPIKVAAATWKHYHRTDKDPEELWCSETWPDLEPHWEWLETTPYGGLDVHAHISCAKMRMPYADFENGRPERPAIVPEGGMPKDVGLETCSQCGLTATLEEATIVAARIYGSGMGNCVYCGKKIKLEKMSVSHFWWDGKHCEKWQWKDWRWEQFLHWTARKPDATGAAALLEFYGHYDCTLKAMPYMTWLEDQPRCNCESLTEPKQGE